jgi:putative flippase GtrA
VQVAEPNSKTDLSRAQPQGDDQRQVSALQRARQRTRTFRRHQLSALLATGLDFSVMTLSHELFGVDPVLATVFGASSGGLANFQLGRHWVFGGARDGRVFGQALRYACVSLGCVVLNALGMGLLGLWAGPESYVIQRVVVSLLVGFLWSYPAQRWLVFAVRPATSTRASSPEHPRAAVAEAAQSEQVTSLPGGETQV